MIATEPRLAIVWDEGFTLGREARIRAWFRALRDPERFAATWQPPAPLGAGPAGSLPRPRPDQIRTRAQALRPGRARLVLAVRPRGAARPSAVLCDRRPGRRRPDADLGRRCLALGSARCSSSASRPGRIWTFVARRWGRWAATLAAGAWVLQPNLFAHGHYATVDAILASLWVLALIAFAEAVLPRTSARAVRQGGGG